jgi:two-component system cell cycle sensor histidine kinase/response regulator CckA
VVLTDLNAATGGRLHNVSELCSDVDSIRTAGLRASQTVKDLLTLGREGRTPQEPLNLNELVEDVTCEALDPTRGKPPRVELRVELDPQPLVVSASEAQLARAITNLIRNGVEAIDEAGTVHVQTSNIVLGAPLRGFETVPRGEYAVITVADTGGGIPASELPHIFEPFFTNKRARARTGTGLGLAIVHGVTKEHRGFIDVASTIGSGTQFRLYLPRVHQAPKPQSASSLAPGGRGRILVVDDEPLQLHTASRILAGSGYDVTTADSGIKARELFESASARRLGSIPAPGSQRSPYDLVILDMILNEEHDGLQVLEGLRTLCPGQKAILVSGHASSDRLEAAVSKGLAWLAKPYTKDALLKAVYAALEV